MHSQITNILEKAREGALLSAEEGYALHSCSDDDADLLIEAAGAIRDQYKGRTVTYSRKVFLPITNLCRDRCSYCTFRKDPSDPDAWTMSPNDIHFWLGRAREQGCKEALMCLGDRPETAYGQYRRTLAELGHRTSVEYIHRACEMALEYGILPHTNAGVLDNEEMKLLKNVNASLGLMLENISPRLREKGMPHFSAPDKNPAVRMRMISQAGELAIPFTTGILIGIGETSRERIDSLLAIRDTHRKHGHIQEVIIQNFRAKPGTRMMGFPEPSGMETVKTVAVARLLLGGEMNIQVPPNLSPNEHKMLLRAGINDWGGISPVTRDYVNPEAAWPQIDSLARTCREEGFTLRERLAAYPEYIERPGFLSVAPRALARKLGGAAAAGSNPNNLVSFKEKTPS